jgi:glycosyltransferase involved in cell wall biosynthesis
MRIYVDHTHLWRPVTGLERITLELFSEHALAPLDVVPLTAARMSGMLAQQTLGLPARLARQPSSILLCPGFPPTPLLHVFGDRVIPYIHDVFLLSRRGDLNWRAKLYSAWPFGFAVRNLPRFMVNSHDTAEKLAGYCRPDADIMVYRPHVRNLFGLHAVGREDRSARPRPLRLAALGTVEPRKNYLAGARILGALRQRGFADATLEVIGRRGWGGDWEKLEAMPGVVLHGYVPDRQAASILEAADALICTSHEEGLGLPLLEAQYAGLPIVAPDQSVFREVLGRSGVLIDPSDTPAAADAIAELVGKDGWRADFSARAMQNLRRWNELASADRARVIDVLGNPRRRAGRPAARISAAG